MAIADGVDEVHNATVARNVLNSYRPHEGLWPREYLPAKRERARVTFADVLAADRDLAGSAERAEREMSRG
jgi:acyl-CoA dehydrogenase